MKLDVLEVDNNGALGSSGSKSFAWGAKFCKWYWGLGENRGRLQFEKNENRRAQIQGRQAMQEGRFQVAGHRVGNGGRRRRTAEHKLLPEMLQLKERKKIGTGDEGQAMRDPRL